MEMKVLLISFAVGLGVGILYGLIRVKSPAPPIVALLGLLGMVIGEQAGTWFVSKRPSVTQAASICLMGKHWKTEAGVKPAIETQSSGD
jgi:XapX domain-containing protein